jgi:HEAT repeat protein
MESAKFAIGRIGTNSLPWLVKWLREANQVHPWKSQLLHAADKLPPALRSDYILDFLRNDHVAIRAANAVCSFHILGPPGISELTRLMDDPVSAPGLRRAAMAGLSGSAKDGLPLLLRVLVDTRQQDRVLAAYYIGTMQDLGTNSTPAVPVLVQCLKDADPDVAVAAAQALGNLNVEPGVAVPALSDSLQAPRRWLRVAAANSLAEFGQQARPAVPSLVKALSDPDIHVRGRATNALERIAPEVLKLSGAER